MAEEKQAQEAEEKGRSFPAALFLIQNLAESRRQGGQQAQGQRDALAPQLAGRIVGGDKVEGKFRDHLQKKQQVHTAASSSGQKPSCS